MKIKIDNKTDYDTKWLRKIFNRCIRMVHRRMGKKHKLWTDYKVEVVYKQSLSYWVEGRAYLNENRIRLGVPRPPEKMKLEESWRTEIKEKLIKDRKELLKQLPKMIAKTMVHELYHCYGYKHKDKEMKPRKKQKIQNTYNYDWTGKYPVQMKMLVK